MKMKYLKTFEAYEEPINSEEYRDSFADNKNKGTQDKNIENTHRIESLLAIPGVSQEDADGAIEYNIYSGFNKGLKMAEIFYGPLKNKYNTSDDPEWPVYTAIMSDGTKLGFMFEDGYWEKVEESITFESKKIDSIIQKVNSLSQQIQSDKKNSEIDDDTDKMEEELKELLKKYDLRLNQYGLVIK